MTEILTSAQMRAIEAAAIDSGRASGLELMERAGKGVVDATFATWPELICAPGRAVVLCGPGNNGGDGYVIARLLFERGWDLRLYALGDPARLPPDAAANAARWQACDVGSTPLDPQTPAALPEADLSIDALFGIGLTRPLPPGVAGLRLPGHRIAVDVPSGRDADAAQDLGPALPADLCVTFHREKPVHEMLKREGVKIVVADIGL